MSQILSTHPLPNETPSLKLVTPVDQTVPKAIFFSSFEEMINLVAPVLFLAAMIPDLINSAHYRSQHQIYMNLYANVIWMNALHATFFLSFPFMNKNSRSWFTGVNNERALKNILVGALIVGGTFFCFCFTLKIFPATTRLEKTISELGFLFLLVVPVIHYMRQSYGLSRLYDLTRKPRGRSFDFYGYHSLLLMLIISKFALLTTTLYTFDSLTILRSISAAAFSIISVLVLSAYIGNDLKNGTKKALFQLRLFLYPMGFFHPLAGIFAKGFHGIEYFYVTKRLTSDQKINRTFYKIFIVTCLVTIALILVHMKSLSNIFYQQHQMPKWILVSSALLYSFVQLHYWADLYLFSLKPKDVVAGDTPIARLKNT